MLCLHECLPVCILFIFLIFSSVSACTPRLSLLLTDMHLCSFSSSMLQLLHLMLLHACITHNNNILLCSAFSFIHVVHLLHPSTQCFCMLIHNHRSPSSDIRCNSSLPQLHFLEPQHPLSVLHVLCVSKPLPDHHHHSSASLAVIPMRSSSLGVMLRFLSLC
jgi:hypothetical protein